MLQIYNEDCKTYMQSAAFREITTDREVIIVTDPPFNVGYHYNTYKDNKSESEYYEWLKEIFQNFPLAIIHYPESLYKLAHVMGRFPSKVVSWVYNSNTAKQHRDIAYFDISPDFNLVRQPYKNPSDKRIQERIARGMWGGRLYDWWNINQVKNVSKIKTQHPCQMPQDVMDKVVGIIPRTEKTIIFDPFLGSGTTGAACLKYGIDFIGTEIDETYYSIAKERMASQLDIFQFM